MTGIYKITSPTGKVYVGQSVNLKRRIRDYTNNCKSQTRVIDSFNTHGADSHSFMVIEECDISIMNDRERYWQEFYDVCGDNGLNCLLTQTDTKKRKMSDQSKIKMRNSQLGKKHNPETILKMIDYHAKNPMTAEKKHKLLLANYRKRIDLSNTKYNNLTAVNRSLKPSYWFFKCDCGRIKEYSSAIVKSGKRKDCGCLIHKKIISK